MLKLFEDRYNLLTLKFHLENSIDEQYWARDILSKYVSSKFNGCHGNLIMIGPKSEFPFQGVFLSFFISSYFFPQILLKDCGKQEAIETISNFVHVPLLVIGDDAQELENERGAGCKIGDSILSKLLRTASYDMDKASVGIVIFRNVNHYSMEIQKSLAKLMREGNS